jgi:hypothetical protein
MIGRNGPSTGPRKAEIRVEPLCDWCLLELYISRSDLVDEGEGALRYDCPRCEDSQWYNDDLVRMYRNKCSEGWGPMGSSE